MHSFFTRTQYKLGKLMTQIDIESYDYTLDHS